MYNKNSRGGRSFQDREKAAKVRHSVLDCLELVLKEDASVEEWSDYKKDIIRRMSTSILPRLNEVTGQDGGAININTNDKTKADKLVKEYLGDTEAN